MARETMHLLVIDDSEDDRLLYRRALQKIGDADYVIAEADEGEAGLNRIAEKQPDCILLDYSLPGRNGIEVLKRIRSRHPYVPVVMLTGQGNESIAVAAIHEGAQNYITKSTITPETIQRVIRVAVEHCAMEKRIQEQRTALEIFTRALAHDLKEPVRTITSFLDLLAPHQGFNDKEKGYLRYIQNASERMGTLIDTVYFYTRLDGMPEQIEKETCDVSAVLEDAKENIRQLIEERGAIVTSDLLPTVYMNRMHLLQMLQNLLCNSIRHCEQTPVIHVHADERENEWMIRITDNGIGVGEEFREQIFEPFKRATRHKEQGLGLGLAVCKKIVESYGGRIWYETGVDKGAVFVFTLPKEMPALAGNAQVKMELPSLQGEHQKMATIMLVEDSEADIELTKILLIERERLGCHLLVARDVPEALTLLRMAEEEGRQIDLVLLDINMPGMDGFDLLRKMREQEATRDIPVIMCTTSTYDKDMEKARLLGAAGYVNKPADLGKLKGVLGAVPSVQLQKEREGYLLLRAA